MPFSKAIYRSLIDAPLLVGDLPEAKTFPRTQLRTPADPPPLELGQKLGHLYEDALAHVLDASPGHELLAHNLQIQRDTHSTLGELDFLLRDLDSGKLVHLELATKFYLAVETDTGLALPGPDARDNYFIKLHRLRTRQLPLATRHQQHLPERYRNEPILSQQLIHGCLFDPITATEPATAEFIAPTCRRGRWLPVDQLANHFPPDDTQFRIIPKALWPVPVEWLDDIRLETWSPSPTIDRCLMLRIDDQLTPIFLTPTGYPKFHQEPTKASGS